jgi:hypothetical protein
MRPCAPCESHVVRRAKLLSFTPTEANLYASHASKEPLQFTSAFVTLAPLTKLRSIK